MASRKRGDANAVFIKRQKKLGSMHERGSLWAWIDKENESVDMRHSVENLTPFIMLGSLVQVQV